jgi:hypothetical protein
MKLGKPQIAASPSSELLTPEVLELRLADARIQRRQSTNPQREGRANHRNPTASKQGSE